MAAASVKESENGRAGVLASVCCLLAAAVFLVLLGLYLGIRYTGSNVYVTDYFVSGTDRLSFPYVQPSGPPTSVVDAAGVTRFTLSASPKVVLRNRGGFSTSFQVEKLIPFYVPVEDSIQCLIGKNATDPSGVKGRRLSSGQGASLDSFDAHAAEFTLKFGDFPVLYWILRGAELESTAIVVPPFSSMDISVLLNINVTVADPGVMFYEARTVIASNSVTKESRNQVTMESHFRLLCSQLNREGGTK